jgi:formylglycine-generating enzyme required for sulfatase activity
VSFVFVSHANQDKPKIRHVVDALIAAGIKVWVDNPEAMGYGTEKIKRDFIRLHADRCWLDEIEEALRDAGVVLVCFSNRFSELRDVWHDEAAVGRALGKLVACRIDEVDPQTLRNQYSNRQIPDLRGDRPYAEVKVALDLLVQDVQQVLRKGHEIGRAHIDHIQTDTAGSRGTRDLDQRLAGYFKYLKDTHGKLRPAITHNDSAPSPPLLEVFVALELRNPKCPVKGELDWRNVITGDRDRIVLVGDPGSGKSTLLCHLVLNAIEAFEHSRPDTDGKTPAAPSDPLSRIPIWMDLSKASDEKPENELSEDPVMARMKKLTRFDVAAELLTAKGSTQQKLLLIFDGIDEIADAEKRKAIVDDIVTLTVNWGYPVVIACRRKAWEYGKARRDDRTFNAFEEFSIQAMDQKTWEQFFEKWCRALWKDDADDAHRRLEAAVRKSSDVGKMASSPQTATMLAVLAREGDLPHQRMLLYDKFLASVLDNERMVEYGGAEKVREHFIALAVEIQTRRTDRIPEKQAQRILGRQLYPSQTRQQTDNELCEAGKRLLESLVFHTGLVSSTGRNDLSKDVSFNHSTMREYLVARHYASCPDQLLKCAGDPSWGVAIAMTCAILATNGEEKDFDLLGQILVGLMREEQHGVLLESLKEVSSCINVPRKTFQAVRAEYEKIVSLQQFDTKARAEIADVMGVLGVPLPREEDVPLPRKEMEPERWVEIGDTASWLGSDSEEAWPQEKPSREVHLSRYRIQRWPVLVSEYSRFIDDRGYRRDELWDGPGISWRKESDIEMPKGWTKQKDSVNCPVTGVSWWEARAYARWLAGIEPPAPGECITLPSEAQWERAARGPFETQNRKEDRFPWGKEWDENEPRANCRGVLQGPCATGLFPGGHSAEGIWDLAGNVGEYCLDAFGPPKDEKGPAPHDPCNFDPANFEPKSASTVRGGDWTSSVLNARVSARFPGSLSERNERTGFRCVAWKAPCEWIAPLKLR